MTDRGAVTFFAVALMLGIGIVAAFLFFSNATVSQALRECDALGGVLLRSMRSDLICIDARLIIRPDA